MALATVEALRFSYLRTERPALDGVSLAIEPGDLVALLGPSGSGKSTLLRALAGLTPMTGSVRVDDRELATVPPEQRNVGWVPQTGALFPHLSAQDNVAYGVGGRSGGRLVTPDDTESGGGVLGTDGQVHEVVGGVCAG